MYDVIIIGAGPAGLTAATNTSHRGLKTLVIEQFEKAGGQPILFYPDKVIKDHPGFPIGIIGKELARRLEIQAKNAGADINYNEEVLTIKRNKKIKIKTTKQEYSTERVVLCTGMLNIPRKLPLLKHCKQVKYKIGDINQFKNKNVIVIGGGDNAFDSAIQINPVARDVTIIIRSAYSKAKESTVKEVLEQGIQILYNTELKSIDSDDKIKNLSLINTKKDKSFDYNADIIYSALGFSNINKFLIENGFKLNKDNAIKVDETFETSIKGVYAAGDITGEFKLIAVACAEGIEAALHAFSSIKKPYWLT